MDCDKCCKNLAVFVGGVLFGSAGLKLLSSRDAKKAYTHATYWLQPKISTPSGRSRKPRKSLSRLRKPNPYHRTGGCGSLSFIPGG